MGSKIFHGGGSGEDEGEVFWELFQGRSSGRGSVGAVGNSRIFPLNRTGKGSWALGRIWGLAGEKSSQNSGFWGGKMGENGGGVLKERL